MRHRIKSFLSLLEKTFVFLFSPDLWMEKKAKDSIVRLVSKGDKSNTLGCGFFVDKNKIATSIHVVAQPDPIFAKLSDKEEILSIEGIVAYDVKNNLVILKLSGEGTPLQIGDSDAVQTDESVSVIGYSDGKYKVRKGKVHNIRNSDKWIRTKVNTSSVRSGSPVINSKQEVIGIVAWFGVCTYAIPTSALKVLLPKLDVMESLADWQKRELIRAYAYFNEGKNKYNAEDFDGAAAAFNKAIQLNPEYTFAYFERGVTKSNLGDYSGAIDDYTRVIKLNSEYADAYNNRGWMKYTLGKSKAGQGNAAEAQNFYQEAIDDYTQTTTIDLEHPLAYDNRGWAKAALGDIVSAQGNPEKARSLYQSGIADYFKLADANAQKSGSDSEKGRESTVRVMCWTGPSSEFPYGSGFFVDKDKIVTNIHVVARPGPIFAKLNDKKTIWTVEGVTAYDIEYDIVVLKLAGEGTPLPLGNSDTVQRGEPVVAVGYPDRKYKVSSGNVHGIRNSDKLLGTTAESAKGSSGGPVLNGKGEVVGITTRSDYYNFSVPSNRLKVLLAQSGPSEPLEQWHQRDHIRAYAYHLEGEVRFNAGDDANAIVSFDNAILQNPKHILAYFWRGRAKTNLGKSKADQGDITEAQQLYQAAIDDNTLTLKINPEFALAYNNRGWTQHEFGKSKAGQGDVAEAQQLYKAAINDYTRSIKIDPKYTFPYFSRGLTRTALGKSKAEKGSIAEAKKLYQKAIDDYTQAIKIDPKHVLAHYNRGNAKKALGQSDEAEKDFTKAIELEAEK